jgi:hypothetical protein
VGIGKQGRVGVKVVRGGSHRGRGFGGAVHEAGGMYPSLGRNGEAVVESRLVVGARIVRLVMTLDSATRARCPGAPVRSHRSGFSGSSQYHVEPCLSRVDM